MDKRKSQMRELKKQSNAFRVSIPVDVIASAGFEEGDLVYFEARDHEIVMIPYAVTVEKKFNR